MTRTHRHPGPAAARTAARAVVVDFDGALSWLRHGILASSLVIHQLGTAGTASMAQIAQLLPALR